MGGHVIRQPSRVIVGHCPRCGRVIVVENNYEIWPLVICACDWSGMTTEVARRARYERGGYVADEYHPDVNT